MDAPASLSSSASNSESESAFRAQAQAARSAEPEATLDRSTRAMLRGFVQLLSLSLVGDGHTLAQAPHRRLARLLRSGDAVQLEDTAGWFHTQVHTTTGTHRVNCTAVHDAAASRGGALQWRYTRSLSTVDTPASGGTSLSGADAALRPGARSTLASEHTVLFDSHGNHGRVLRVHTNGTALFQVGTSALVVRVRVALPPFANPHPSRPPTCPLGQKILAARSHARSGLAHGLMPNPHHDGMSTAGVRWQDPVRCWDHVHSPPRGRILWRLPPRERVRVHPTGVGV
jgi:hypothetical protein